MPYKLTIRTDADMHARWLAAADRERVTLRAWALRHLDAAAIDRSTELMQQAQRRYRTAGHPKLCGCGDCNAGG